MNRDVYGRSVHEDDGAEPGVYGRGSVMAVGAAEAATLDLEAQRTAGVPGRLLMENAGRSAAQVLERVFPRGRVVAAVGAGNNGGDAMVLLRTLRAWGREVACVFVGERKPDRALFHEFEIPTIPVEEAERAFSAAAVVVDGILGTGTSGAPRPGVAQVIEAMNRAGRPVVALDVPTGVDPTTGTVPGAAVRATVTVTFGWPKLGLFFTPGRSHCGRIVAVEIGFPPFDAHHRPNTALITSDWVADRLPVRPPDANKGSAGRVLIIGGRPGMAGAVAISAHAATRAGAGYVRVAAPLAVRETVQTLVPDAIFVDRDDPGALIEALEGSHALVVGPGMGLHGSARAALEIVIGEASDAPVLLDADALSNLAAETDRIAELAESRPVILTPHPGEMHRLSGRTVAEIVANPVEMARRFADRTGATILLKGMPSVIAAPGEPVLINTVGSSDLAKAGIGDQLAGTIGAFLAAGLHAEMGADARAEWTRTAAALGLYISGRAADLAGLGRALTPNDVSEHLIEAFADVGPAASSLGLPFVTFDQPARW